MTYRYNVVVEVSIDTDKMNAGNKAQKQALRDIEKETADANKRINNELDKNIERSNKRLEQYEQRLDRLHKRNQETNKLNRAIDRGEYIGVSTDDINKLKAKAAEIDNLSKKTDASTKSLGMWGQAFKGAFIGAVAGMTFSLLIGGIFAVGQAIASAGVESIKAGARFETTTKALEVFAYTTAEAKKELAAMDETARNTPGLRMETAEQGYTRLRALGFEAQQAKSFIKELGEEKILSGASDEALDRIIFNFAQIASGGQKVSQELREILTQMPSMGAAFFDAFGSLDPNKIQSFLNKEGPDAFFKRMTDAMAKQKAAAGGIEDAYGKMLDGLTEVGRELSAEVIPMITDSLQELTLYMRENKEGWKEWGETIADYYFYYEKVAKRFAELTSGGEENIDKSSLRMQRKLAQTLTRAGLPEDYLGNASPISIEEKLRRRGYSQEKIEAYRQQYETENPDAKIPFGTVQYPAEELERRKDIVENAAIQKALSETEEGRKRKALEAERDAQRERERLRRQELERIDDYYSQVANIRENAFALEIAQNQDNAQKVFEIQDRQFNQQIKETQEEYSRKIALEEGNDEEIYKLTIESNNALRDLETKQAIARINFEREQANKRREDLLEANALMVREINKSFEIRERETQRNIDRGLINYEQGYDDLLQMVNDRENILTQKIKDNYNLRLQDKSLTDQEIVNLEKQRDLEIAELQDESLQRTREIEDAKTEAILKNLNFQREQTRQTYEFMSGLASRFQEDFFNPSTFGSRSLGNFRDFVLKEGQKQRLGNELETAKGVRSEMYSSYQIETDWQKQNKLYSAYLKSVFAIDELEKKLESLEKSIPPQYKLFGYLADQIGKSTGAFDRLNEAILQHRQRLDSSEADAEITYWENVIKFSANADAVREAGLKLQQARNAKERLDYDQNVEKAELYRRSIKGINDEIKQLTDRDPEKLGGLKDIFDKQQGEEVKNTLEQIVMLEYELASPDITAEYRVRAEVLQHILDIRNEEVEAVIRIQKAQIDLGQKLVFSKNKADADLLEFLASQKGITEILSDARINLLTEAFKGLDAVAASLAKNFGFAKDMAQELISSLLKLAANQIFQKLFGVSLFGGNGGNGGGFGLGGFGGRGIGGNPGFNPNGGGLNFGGGGGAGGGMWGGWNQFSSDRINLARAIGVQPAGSAPPAGAIASGSGLFAGLGGMLPLLGAGLGVGVGQGGIGGSILGGLGGLLGGGIGAAFLSPGLFGVGTAAGSSPLMAGLYGFLTNPFTIAAAGALLVGAFFIGRSAKRRKEEKLREKAMVDAFKSMDKLIEQVNNDQIDGAQALEQADSIRQQYLDSVGKLTDKKTRNIAIKDVARLDAKIALLKNAVASQTSRRQRMELYAPTFAEGGATSKFARDNFRNNPLGYQRGGEKLGYFPAANQYAIYNEKGSEYIFDAETTRNVGTDRLDLIRHTKGQALNSMLFRWNDVQKKAEGGSLNIFQQTAPAQATASNGQATQVHIHVDGSTIGQAIAQAISIVIQENDGSSKQINAISTGLENQGQTKLVEQLAELVKEKLGLQ